MKPHPSAQGRLWPDDPQLSPSVILPPIPPDSPHPPLNDPAPPPPLLPPQTTRDAVSRLLDELAQQLRLSPAPSIEWSARMRRLLGRAYLSRNLIRLSAWLSREQALETLRHELAHIAAGVTAEPHGPKWREWAVRLGANPRATSRRPPDHAPDHPANRRYTGLECPGCGLRFIRARVLSGLFCRACGPRRGTLAKRIHGPRETIADWASSQR